MEQITGLTPEQVAQRHAAGQTNCPPQSQTKTVKQIIKDNCCTYFNLVFIVLAAMLAAVGSWLNMSFLIIVVCNTVIGIVQQLRAKKTIDKLTLLSAQKLRCLRGGTWAEQLSDELVKDDVVEFFAGDQIVADARVLSGSAQANESLLTGEAQPVPKREGDELRSGSFLMSGHCVARLTRVGAESYANKLAAAARNGGEKVQKGEMMRSLDKLIRGIGIALIPMGAGMLYNQHAVLAKTWQVSIESTVASLIGMIPEGLYLLTSVALALGMLRLAKKRVLTQDMNCIETLARVDVLCLDKTGTITENVMQADEPIALAGAEGAPLEQVLNSFYTDEKPDNDTARALCARFGQGQSAWFARQSLPFNTAYKYSGKDFGANGVYIIGAPDIVAGTRAGELTGALEPLLNEGRRVLLLAKYDAALPQNPALTPLDAQKLTFLALLPLQNRIRETAPQTLRYFAEQGVKVKVISGDSPQAVSHVAAKAGIESAESYVDAATLTDDAALAAAAERYTVFGRVSPEQKRKLVCALQAKGHTVAMTGDGVNDVLALKQADCGVAMASGAQAAQQVAKLVLLDSDFASLPSVVAEGRRVINNIQRSASLFLVKNCFSMLLSLASLFLALPYPFQPLHLSLLSAVTIGLPSFVLAIEPNTELVHGKFLHNVLREALPGGLTDFILVLYAMLFGYAFSMPDDTTSTICVLLMLAVGLAVLWQVCCPFTPLHGVLWAGCAILGVAGVTVLAPWLGLVVPDLGGWLVLVALLALVIPTLFVLTNTNNLLHKWAGSLAQKLHAARRKNKNKKRPAGN